jgi:hypothetical protein
LDAKIIVDAIAEAIPSDTYIVFMGFCPDADFENRLDVDWKEKGVCTFEFLSDDRQKAAFYSILVNDLIILKKNAIFGKTMKLYGCGRVKSIEHNEKYGRYLVMDWSKKEEIIEVPSLACTSTVNIIKTIEEVEKYMPKEFFNWLDGMDVT